MASICYPDILIQIEDSLLFCLYCTMKQDKNTTTNAKEDLHMGMIKKMALSIRKLAKPTMGNKSIKLTGKMIGMDVEYCRLYLPVFQKKKQEALKQTK